jgi:hypothetical protein
MFKALRKEHLRFVPKQPNRLAYAGQAVSYVTRPRWTMLGLDPTDCRIMKRETAAQKKRHLIEIDRIAAGNIVYLVKCGRIIHSAGQVIGQYYIVNVGEVT